MLRGKIKVHPSLFLTTAKYDDVIGQCTVTKDIEIGSMLSIQHTLQKISRLMHSVAEKKEIDGKRVVAISSINELGTVVAAVITKDEKGFSIQIKSSSDDVATSICGEIKNLLNQ